MELNFRTTGKTPKENCSIYLFHESKININPILNSYSFYLVKYFEITKHDIN